MACNLLEIFEDEEQSKDGSSDCCPSNQDNWSSDDCECGESEQCDCLFCSQRNSTEAIQINSSDSQESDSQNAVFILSKNFRHITIDNLFKEEMDSLLDGRKSSSFCYRKLVRYLLPNPFVWTTGKDKLFDSFSDYFLASHGKKEKEN